MRKQIQLLFLILIFGTIPFQAQTEVRTDINIPDIPGYKTLKCDFHMHTVFSDGNVWPTIRTIEAWREGLDAIAITDHIEYLPHKKDINIDFNRSYEIANSESEKHQVTVIKGGEITRRMPPGHLNGIFLNDVSKLKTEKWEDAVKAAYDQGAFIFWNHPGWKGQQKDGVSKWYDEHSMILENGWLHGIEVVNEREYYPEVHQWCLDRNLTMMSNSDIHDPTNMFYEIHKGDHRPVTLVFAMDNTETSIKEALFDRRTVVYAEDFLVGREMFLKPIFEKSIKISETEFELTGNSTKHIQIKNCSDIDYKLVLEDTNEFVSVPEEIILYGNKIVLFWIKAKKDDIFESQKIKINYKVENLKVKPNEGLPVILEFDITKKK
ncbi:MAG: hypothetical protein JEY94_04700 [Melioribacteraceae bacterium]|nr:hypothetical protein [Melioribacteraceae bacterium]